MDRQRDRLKSEFNCFHMAENVFALKSAESKDTKQNCYIFNIYAGLLRSYMQQKFKIEFTYFNT